MKVLTRAALVFVVFAGSARASDPVKDKDFNAKAAFAILKSFAGEWVGPDKDHKIIYKVTAGGSAVEETILPGSPMEMVSMYHLDGDTLRMTHYCAAGNQPRTKLDLKASTPELLVFAFDGGTNFDPAKDMHMHEGRITIKDAKHMETEWIGYQNGKPAGSHKVSITRP